MNHHLKFLNHKNLFLLLLHLKIYSHLVIKLYFFIQLNNNSKLILFSVHKFKLNLQEIFINYLYFFVNIIFKNKIYLYFSFYLNYLYFNGMNLF
jgi:hypothetical protein